MAKNLTTTVPQQRHTFKRRAAIDVGVVLTALETRGERRTYQRQEGCCPGSKETRAQIYKRCSVENSLVTIVDVSWAAAILIWW